MRVKARLDGGGILLWLFAIALASVFTYLDADDPEPSPPEDADLIWMDLD